MHCIDCGCVQYFDSACVLYRDRDLSTRLIVEAGEMAHDDFFQCVSEPSILLTWKELCFFLCAG